MMDNTTSAAIPFLSVIYHSQGYPNTICRPVLVPLIQPQRWVAGMATCTHQRFDIGYASLPRTAALDRRFFPASSALRLVMLKKSQQCSVHRTGWDRKRLC